MNETKPKVGLDRSKTGRAKGTPNKNTKEIKAMIEGALRAAGGQDYLLQQAKENPSAFLTLVGKILPKQIDANVEHSGGVNIVHASKSWLAEILNDAAKK